ncbi:iron-containing alcohol dehydrogenase [Streptomyces xanthochromogenes]|uniref:iron-containing alcohol dehydrogenase n=1 Tax=Streptomyces xanthochromogenes TaxID=67384 RepID=UPI00382AF7E3
MTTDVPALWERPTRLRVGTESAVRALAEGSPGGGTVLLADSALPATLIQRLADAGGAEHVRLLNADGEGRSDLTRSMMLCDLLRGARRVVAVGGGTVLDLVALARLLSGDQHAAARIQHGGPRPGLVICPPVRRPHTPELLALPTTIGTAAEVSPVATTVLDGHRKLVVAGQLAADTAALDPDLTRTLPSQQLREGVLEAMFRILNAYVMKPGSHVPSAADAEAMELLGQLAALGCRPDLTAGDTPDAAARCAAVRTDAALLSARTVLGWCQLGRDPFAGKIWYVANELATATGARKMVATLAAAPWLWQRALDGDARYGQADRVRQAWDTVTSRLPHLPADPAAGLRALAAQWHLPACPPSRVPAAELARRAVRAWGAGLPMLGQLRTAELRSLYTDILDGEPHDD